MVNSVWFHIHKALLKLSWNYNRNKTIKVCVIVYFSSAYVYINSVSGIRLHVDIESLNQLLQGGT